MIKKKYKNYLIESEGFKNLPLVEYYGREARFKIKNKGGIISFRFLMSGINFDTKTTENDNPEKYFFDLCLEKVKEYIDSQDNLTDKAFEYRGSFFIENEQFKNSDKKSKN